MGKVRSVAGVPGKSSFLPRFFKKRKEGKFMALLEDLSEIIVIEKSFFFFFHKILNVF